MGLVGNNFRSILIIVFALLYYIGIVSASHFRCHCNEPSCVRTAYLCKSQMGCYMLKTPTPSPSSDWSSNVKSSPTNQKTRRPSSSRRQSPTTSGVVVFKYGCIEYLADDLTYKCWSDDVLDLLKNPNKIRIMQNRRDGDEIAGDFSKKIARSTAGKSSSSSKSQQKLTCCFDDLCNNGFEQNMQIRATLTEQARIVKDENLIDSRLPTATNNHESNTATVDPLTGFYNPTLILFLLFICFVCLFLMARFVYYDFFATARKSKSSSLIVEPIEPRSLIKKNNVDQENQYYDEQNINWQSSRLDEKLKTFTLLMSKNDHWLDSAKNIGEKR